MGELITSAYDGPKLTVSEMLEDPTFIPQRVVDGMQGQFLEDLFFRQAENNKGVVAFREAAGQYLADDAEEIAEFGEIPVSAPELGPLRAAYGIKSGEAIRISYEMRNENKVDQVNRHIQALEKTMIRHGIQATLGVFKSAKVQELQVSSQWTGGDPVKDVFDAVELVQSAHDDDDVNRQFDYEPNTILLHPASYTKLVRNEQMQKYYIGNAALDNPIFLDQNGDSIFGGLRNTELFGTLRVATSRLIEQGTAYVFEAQGVGFKSDTMPLTATPMYSEGGDSQLGGPTMSWRSDLVRKRAIAVDNPKAIVKLTGIA
ncbi:phage major capsid protein [Corynebacterium segmentosum]